MPSAKEEFENSPITIESNGRTQVYEVGSAMHKKFLSDMVKQETQAYEAKLDHWNGLATSVIETNEELFNNEYVKAIAYIAVLDEEGNIQGWECEIKKHPAMVRTVMKHVEHRRTKEEMENEEEETE